MTSTTLPNPAFPTCGEADGGREVHIHEGLAHSDVLVAEDDPDSDILGPLGEFVARSVR